MLFAANLEDLFHGTIHCWSSRWSLHWTHVAGYTEDAEELVSLSKCVKEFMFPCGVSPSAGGVCRGAAWILLFWLQQMTDHLMNSLKGLQETRCDCKPSACCWKQPFKCLKPQILKLDETCSRSASMWARPQALQGIKAFESLKVPQLIAR